MVLMVFMVFMVSWVAYDLQLTTQKRKVLTTSTVHKWPSDQVKGTAALGSQSPNWESPPTTLNCCPKWHSLSSSNFTLTVGPRKHRIHWSRPVLTSQLYHEVMRVKFQTPVSRKATSSKVPAWKEMAPDSQNQQIWKMIYNQFTACIDQYIAKGNCVATIWTTLSSFHMNSWIPNSILLLCSRLRMTEDHIQLQFMFQILPS